MLRRVPRNNIPFRNIADRPSIRCFDSRDHQNSPARHSLHNKNLLQPPRPCPQRPTCPRQLRPRGHIHTCCRLVQTSQRRRSQRKQRRRLQWQTCLPVSCSCSLLQELQSNSPCAPASICLIQIKANERLEQILMTFPLQFSLRPTIAEPSQAPVGPRFVAVEHGACPWTLCSRKSGTIRCCG